VTRTTARAALTLAARAVLFFGMACADHAPTGAAPTLSFQTSETQPHFGAVTVTHLNAQQLGALERVRLTDEDWQKILVVHAGDSTGLPMLGAYVIAHDTLRFEPRFPPIRGTTYMARYDGAAFAVRTEKRAPSAADSVSTAKWTREPASGPATSSVVDVYPTTDSVPMNLLRMYVQFSAPMTVGDGAEKHVRLLDERGAVVDKAFLIAAGGQELWDPEHTRLTIFFDPGRIKRDLTPHEALGLPLRQGHSYSLIIDSTMHDARGLPLTRGYVKRFRVGPIDRTLPRVSAWRVVAPATGTFDPVTVELPEPLDHALLSRMLTVTRGVNGVETVVSGGVATGNHDRRWTFTPSNPWAAATYVVKIDTELEDLAGNNLRRLFDVMPGDSAARGEEGAVVRIPFTPRARSAADGLLRDGK
jgi:hypothetical protein